MELFFNKNYRDKLNSDSKILYGFLLNRLTLSAKNNWIDENGNVFLIFTRKEVQERLDLSDKTVTKAFKQLKDCKLIHEKRQGALCGVLYLFDGTGIQKADRGGALSGARRGCGVGQGKPAARRHSYV